MSRVIVKNIPKEITEIELKNHFNKQGEITDIKIIRNEKGESRKFAFIGYKTNDQANNSIKYFNNTYVKTCKVQLEEAKVQGDSSLSKFNKNSNKKNIPQAKIKKDAKEIKTDVENTDISTDSNETSLKVNKLLELAKQMSNKTKFDAIGEKLNKDKEKEKEKSEDSNKLPIDAVVIANAVSNHKEKQYNPKRLYLRNLAFEVKEEDLRSIFEKFGELAEVHIPINRHNNLSFGYAYITFFTVESAVLALSEMDKTYFQGRILHITPSLTKEEKIPTQPFNNYQASKSEFKKTKKTNQTENFDDETNWNYLFMNQNSVIESVARKLNIPKSEIMSRENPDMAVQVAAMETSIISESKDWLNQQGINLDALKGKRSECFRSKNIILIKNISTNVNKEKLEEYFSRYGLLVRFLLSPSNTIGLAEYVDKKHAENCMKKLAYFEIDGLPLYLEYAPEGFLHKGEKVVQGSISGSNDNNKPEINLTNSQGKVVFITNLNFSTKESRLIKFLQEKGFSPINVKIVTHKKTTADQGDDNANDKILSSGFGFVEFESEETTQKCLRMLQGALLDAHSLKLSLAKSNKEDKFSSKKRKAETELNNYEYEGDNIANNKILVKNLAFEANKEELRKLFKTFGEVKSLRLPSKLDGSHRGFAFVDFVSHDEAKVAFKSLLNTHFYGRKLVLEWAQKEKTVEDLRLDTERKVNAINIRTHRTQMKGDVDISLLKKFKKVKSV